MHLPFFVMLTVAICAGPTAAMAQSEPLAFGLDGAMGSDGTARIALLAARESHAGGGIAGAKGKSYSLYDGIGVGAVRDFETGRWGTAFFARFEFEIFVIGPRFEAYTNVFDRYRTRGFGAGMNMVYFTVMLFLEIDDRNAKGGVLALALPVWEL